MLLSVVIPVYNTKPSYIKEALDSTQILHELCDYEVIVVNDGSSSTETCTFLLSLEGNAAFKIVHQENKGPGEARNTGIRMAQGHFIFPLDSDDCVHPEVSFFIDAIKKYSHIDVFHGERDVFGHKQERYPFDKLNAYDQLFRMNTIMAGSIYKKVIWERIGGYDETFQTVEDWDFWCRCLVANAQFMNLPYANYSYRLMHDGQSLLQKTQHLVETFHQKTLDKLPLSYITLQGMNDYMLDRLQKKPRKVFGLLLYLYFPRLYEALCSKGWFSYKKNFLK